MVDTASPDDVPVQFVLAGIRMEREQTVGRREFETRRAPGEIDLEERSQAEPVPATRRRPPPPPTWPRARRRRGA
jgi:hypothetical protein